MALPAVSETDQPTGLPALPPGAYVAFVDDADSRICVEAEVPLVLAGHAPLHVAAGGIAAAMEITDWPEGLGGLIIDIVGSPSPVADIAALMGMVPADCVVLAIGEANDVTLFRDLMGTGVADYLVRPLADGVLHKALDKALSAKAREAELRNAKAALQAVASGGPVAGRAGSDETAPLVVACAGTRGGVGTTTLAIALASMLGQARSREALILDLDFHYGSVMLALDLDPTDALQEAMATPDRVDNLFVDQTVQRKSELLCALGSEQPPQVASAERLHEGALPTVVSKYQQRFRQIVFDVPRGDPIVQRQAFEAATDFVLVCDQTLAGARDAMRLLNLAAESAPHLRIHVVASGVIDPKKAPIKMADLERSVKQKVVCQIGFDDKTVAAAINAGKPVNEAAPRSVFAKSLQPLVTTLVGSASGVAKPTNAGPFWAKLLKPKSKPASAGAGG
ncbi:MAG TPA: cellulose synthase operon protein YhjQ/BcsQ [Vineibacter sp.]|nr:cellulose synthase operon protein YhjQ/BcsQ [Vineibacter sp.]